MENLTVEQRRKMIKYNAHDNRARFASLGFVIGVGLGSVLSLMLIGKVRIGIGIGAGLGLIIGSVIDTFRKESI